ncbi:MAG: MMPL family transporter [Pirellulaceae bacterium]|nr:MMPL family transporter [Pirellulaceae bacterium]
MMSPWLATASQRSLESMFNAPAYWVPETIDYRRDSTWFTEAFRGHETVLLSFPDCDVNNHRLAEFSKAIMEPVDASHSKRNKRLFQYVTSGPEILERLTAEPLQLTRQTALARLTGSFFGSDRESTLVMVALTLEGGRARNDSIAAIREAATGTLKLDADELVMVGSVVDGSAIDEASMASIDNYTIPSAILVVILCWICLRSWILTGIIITAACCGQGLVLGMVSLQGTPMNAILIVLPVLVYALTVSAGVHLSNYYRDANSQQSSNATRVAINNGWLPCVLATFTTVIGLASLSVSVMTPIRDFSLFSCLGISLTVAVLFLLLPFGMDMQSKINSRSKRGINRWTTQYTRCADGLAAFIGRAPNLIVAIFAVAMCVLAVGVGSIETSVNIRALFKDDSRILSNYRWMEDRLGPLVPFEVVIRFSPENEMSTLERIELVRDAHVRIATLDDVGGTLSAATFLPNIPRGHGVRATARRAVMNRQFYDARQHLIDIGYLAIDEQGQSWRIGTRVSAIEDIDYGIFLDQIRNRLNPFLSARSDDTVTAIYTGSLPVAYQAQRGLLDDLFVSYLTAFTLVALVMIVLLRQFFAGIMVMLPNLFPTFLLFGWMGWSEIPVDIGSVMTASVALGIAVDDTLHFLIWYRRQTAAGLSPQEAVRDCYYHCGRAMTQTSLILSAGLVLYLWSDFVPTQRFAGMMMGLLAAALIGDLLLLPAVLLGRFSNLFLADSKKQ